MEIATERGTRPDHALTITRSFDAPVALVFRLWEDPDHLRRWLGPTDFGCTALEWEFREGADWRACIESKAQGAIWMGGRIREIVRDRRIVFTFAWEDDGVETLVTVDFEPRGAGALQRFHQTPFASVESRDSHVTGWNECFDREAAYAAVAAAEGRA